MENEKEFLLKEYEQISTAYNSSSDRRNSLLRLYFLIVALPISLFSIIINNHQLMESWKRAFFIISLLIICSGFLILNSLISIHKTKVTYAKTLNNIRGYFVGKDRYWPLPTSYEEPHFYRYESFFYECMIISLFNSAIFGISFYYLFDFSEFKIIYTLILICLIFLIHLIVYTCRLKREDENFQKKMKIA